MSAADETPPLAEKLSEVALLTIAVLELGDGMRTQTATIAAAFKKLTDSIDELAFNVELLRAGI